jgi:hypothetical protein
VLKKNIYENIFIKPKKRGVTMSQINKLKLIPMCILFLILFPIPLTQSVSQSTERSPIKDTYLDLDNPTSNYGMNDYVYFGYAYGGRRIALLQYNISGLNIAAMNFSGELSVSGSNPTVKVRMYVIYEDFLEYEITWMNDEIFTNYSYTGNLYDQNATWFYAGGSNLNLNIGIESIQNIDRVTIMFQSEEISNFNNFRFYSREYAEQYSWIEAPKLVIQLESASPPPSSSPDSGGIEIIIFLIIMAAIGIIVYSIERRGNLL